MRLQLEARAPAPAVDRLETFRASGLGAEQMAMASSTTGSGYSILPSWMTMWPVFDAGFAQAQMQPAPACQYGGAVEAAAEHAALVVDVRLQRDLQAQLVVFPLLDTQPERAGQRNVVVKDGFRCSGYRGSCRAGS